jgi:uncharacterized protein YkwD
VKLLRSHVLFALLAALGAGTVSLGCGGGGSSGGGGAPTNNTPTGGAAPTSLVGVGSAFWHLNDDVNNPNLKTHSSTEAQAAAEVLNRVNQERAANSLGPLSYDIEAERAAKAHAEDMVGRGYFNHNSPEGWTPSNRLTMTGASGYSSVGENIAYGYGTPTAVMDGWVASSGHRANILNSSYTHIGIGVDEGSGPHWVQVFLRRP